MADAQRLAGFRVLVVEDEALIAMLVEDYLTDLGCDVVQVVGTLTQGLALVHDAGLSINGAMLDINLGGEKVFPIADALCRRRIPIVFSTGYGTSGLEPRFAGYPVIAKPFGFQRFKATVLSAWA